MRNFGGLTLDAYVRAYLPPFGVLRTDRFNDVTRRPPNFLFVCFAFFTPSLYLVLSRVVRFIALEPSILPTRRTNLRRRIEKAYVRRFAEFSICCRSTRECAGCVSCTRTWVPTYWLHRLRGFVGKRGPEKVYRIGKRMKVEVQEMGKKKEREREREREKEKENERGERLQGKTGTWREWREFIITSRGQQGSLCSDALFKSENPPRRAFKCCRFVIPLNTARCRRY